MRSSYTDFVTHCYIVLFRISKPNAVAWERIDAMTDPSDLQGLPDDLPIPEDDGAADHLLDAAVPAIALPSTSGQAVDLADAARETLVLYVYPATGVPGQPLPAGWDEIPGARGCTPQSCAFRDSARDLADLGASVFGLSAQSLTEQREFSGRERIPYPLLHDGGFRLADELGLPSFEVDGRRYYRRLTFIARRGQIEKVFYPVFPPQENAADVVAWLERDGA
jgi:peroxiredoxin